MPDEDPFTNAASRDSLCVDYSLEDMIVCCNRFVDRLAVVFVLVEALAWTAPLRAQHEHHTSAVTVSASDIDAYLAAARRATAAIQTPEAARAAGYVPIFGNAPLQGEHYARPDLVMRDSFDVDHPGVVMFASVGGKPTLVGVAYTYYLPADSMRPRGFTGPADVWHSHEDIARVPGKHIVMMHTWLVDSPFGVLAHDNPWLPYFAARLTPPPAKALADTMEAELIRRAGLALALVFEPPTLIDLIQRQAGADLAGRTVAEKARITGLAARLREAQQTADAEAASTLRLALVVRGDSLVALYREGAKGSPRMSVGMDTLVAMYVGARHGPPSR